MILFIHPKTGMQLREILPMSLPALIHRLNAPVIGRFHDEWTPDDARRASIVLMDVHWYLSLKSAIALSHRLKRINPTLPIIAGGISASLFAKQLFRDSAIDYIIRGDAEVPLSHLVNALLNGDEAEISRTPNLITRDFVSPERYCLTRDDLDASNFRDISFFPTLERQIYHYQRIYKDAITIPTFPYLMVYRGCPLDCPACCGALTPQSRLFGRSWILRSAEKVAEDLHAWSADPRIRFINVFHDFVSMLPLEYSRRVLSAKYALDVSYEFFDLPTEEQLALFLDAFSGGKLLFALGRRHNATPHAVDSSALIRCIRQVQAVRGYTPVLGYVRRFRQDPHYDAAFRRVTHETGVATYQVDFWWEDFPVPDVRGEGSELDYQRMLSWENKYWLMNALYRIGIGVYRFSPSLARAVSHRLFS